MCHRLAFLHSFSRIGRGVARTTRRPVRVPARAPTGAAEDASRATPPPFGNGGQERAARLGVGHVRQTGGVFLGAQGWRRARALRRGNVAAGVRRGPTAVPEAHGRQQGFEGKLRARQGCLRLDRSAPRSAGRPGRPRVRVQAVLQPPRRVFLPAQPGASRRLLRGLHAPNRRHLDPVPAVARVRREPQARRRAAAGPGREDAGKKAEKKSRERAATAAAASLGRAGRGAGAEPPRLGARDGDGGISVRRHRKRRHRAVGTERGVTYAWSRRETDPARFRVPTGREGDASSSERVEFRPRLPPPVAAPRRLHGRWRRRGARRASPRDARSVHGAPPTQLRLARALFAAEKRRRGPICARRLRDRRDGRERRETRRGDAKRGQNFKRKRGPRALPIR